MPCLRCSNGKWRWGERGRCQFDSREHCERAAAAIRIRGSQQQRRADPARIIRFQTRAINSATMRGNRARSSLIRAIDRIPTILPAEQWISRVQGLHEHLWDELVVESAKHGEDEAWYDKLLDEAYIAAIGLALQSEEPPSIGAAQQQPAGPRTPRSRLAPPVRLSRQAIHRQQRAILKERKAVLLRRVGRQVRRDLGEALDQLFDAGVRDPDVIAEVIHVVDRRASFGPLRRIAQTEMTRANAEATLAVFEQRGFRRVEAKVEWTTRGDSRVCPRCAALEGKVFRIEEAHGLIPLHASCRCMFVPASRTRIATRSLPRELSDARTPLEIPTLGRPVDDPRPRRVTREVVRRRQRSRQNAA